MLWGSALAMGTESFRRRNDQGEAIALALYASKQMVESFLIRSDTTECEEITGTDFNKKWEMAKYMLTGKPIGCFNLAANWAPEAIKTARKALDMNSTKLPKQAISCASEVIKKMGGTDEEAVMVAGFAGGLGLSGSGCGALGAAIWKTTLELIKIGEWKYTTSNPTFDKIVEKFYEASDYKMECGEICGKTFNSIEEHTEYIKNGGCKKIIETVATA